ncbi:hypothetical protein Bca52824_073774 [Brassica carinata]|uniref:Uncharacterized protein n=1 Tax=Brassica carinata TaxID=52824 RepID=A0A8X7QDL9_BRACI|nr:hypothetical protein Bca52824_073774 [Brassica carinata]
MGFKERSRERRFTPTCSLLWILGGRRRRSPIRPKLPPSLRSLTHKSSDINNDDEDDAISLPLLLLLSPCGVLPMQNRWRYVLQESESEEDVLDEGDDDEDDLEEEPETQVHPEAEPEVKRAPEFR